MVGRRDTELRRTGESVSSQLSYVEAVVVGAFQGVTELFPVSSLGHAVLVPALVGGRWAQDLNVSAPNSPYLAFIVGLHVATAAALLVFFWRDWLAIVGGFITSVRHRRVGTTAERLAWLMVLATIPVGIAGLALGTCSGPRSDVRYPPRSFLRSTASCSTQGNGCAAALLQ
ncbi:MAG: putative bacitracin resistance protein [Mycobacterium sp.]|nr:putative bacitracin resistance protein [Mycobacterium sp.]